MTSKRHGSKLLFSALSQTTRILFNNILKNFHIHNDLRKVKVVSGRENLLFGGTQACNNSKQIISIDSFAKTRSQNKTLEASLVLLSCKLDLIPPRGPLYLHSVYTLHIRALFQLKTYHASLNFQLFLKYTYPIPTNGIGISL